MRKLILIIFIILTVICSRALDITGNWHPCNGDNRAYHYTFDNDGNFTFTSSKDLSLNSVSALSGKYEHTDTTITFLVEKYLENTPDCLEYNSTVKDWIFNGENAKWIELDSILESECEFSIKNDTIFILRTPYVRQ